MTSANVAAGIVGCCLRVCFEIAEQLVIAKHNKEECRSLHTAVTCINTFLERVPEDNVSAVAGKVLEALLNALTRAKSLITRVTNTGPLVALLTASVIRDEFLRINRDLTSTFQILASGENLLNITSTRSQLTEIQRQLSKTKTFFLKQEQGGERLRDVAAVAVEQHTPDELLHRALLDQLEQYSEVAQLTPQQLLEELQALQMAAMYGGEQDMKAGKGKSLGAEAEDFLVQQLCAALSPKASQAGPLTPSSAADVPDGYSCPISQEVMSNPVILVETGQSYEAANIQRWLAAHNTCPATGKTLTSKQLVPNYNLKKSIHDWASQHGVVLPANASRAASFSATTPSAPHVSLLVNDNRPHHNSSRNTTRSGSTVATVQRPLGYPTSSTSPAADTAAPGAEADSRSLLAAVDTAGPETPDNSRGLSHPTTPHDSKQLKSGVVFRCTRTLWAAAFIVLVLGAAVGVGTGVGIYLTRRPTAQGSIASSPAPTSGGSPAPQAAASSLDASPATSPNAAAESAAPAAATGVSESGNVSTSTTSANISSPSPSPEQDIRCPPPETVQVTGAAKRGSVWGSDPYTLESDWGVAAVHAGVIKDGQNATVLLRPAGYLDNYEESTRNGATTLPWSSYWCGVRLELVTNSTDG